MLATWDVEVGVLSGDANVQNKASEENEYQTNAMTCPILHHSSSSSSPYSSPVPGSPGRFSG
jgi:hypothetical protein